MSIKLIAIDVDQTLLNSNGQVLPSTVKAVQAALAANIKVVLCSGRPLAGVQPYLTQLGISGADQYVITFNGAVTESVAGTILAQSLINNPLYRELTAFSKAQRVPLNVLDRQSIIYTADRDVNWVMVQQAWENHAGLLIREPDELPTDFQIAKAVFTGEGAQLDAAEPRIRASFSNDLYIVRASTHFLEIMNARVNKGQALADLAHHLGFAPEDVLAIGDEQNDLPMFKVAGTAIAMGNGSAAAKRAADAVTGTNDADGVAQAIEKWALQAN